MQRTLSVGIFALSVLIGAAAVAYPFLLPGAAIPGISQTPASQQTPALTLILLALTLAVLLLEVQGQSINARVVAALGVLVAATAVLRFIEVAIPGPGGFSPIFVPVILSGYVFGARFGFLMGSLTLLVSALLTGGVGPWLPYQMLCAGWVGLTAGWLPELDASRRLLAMLTLFAFLWGILYGILMNLFFWPYMGAGAAGGSSTVADIGSLLSGYGVFYVTTSLVWDLTRALGNAGLMLILGLPAVHALERFRDRFQFQVVVK